MDRTTILVLLTGVAILLVMTQGGIELARGVLPQGGLVNLQGPDFETQPVSTSPLAGIFSFLTPETETARQSQAVSQVTVLEA